MKETEEPSRVRSEGREEEQTAQEGDIWELEERRQLARSGLTAKCVKDLEDTGALDGM